MEFNVFNINDYTVIEIAEDIGTPQKWRKLDCLIHKLLITGERNIAIRLKEGVVVGAHFIGTLVLTALTMRGRAGNTAIICGDEEQENFFRKWKMEKLMAIYSDEAAFRNALALKENRHATILCVDDEKSALNALRRTLDDQPYRVLTALSGEEALSKAREEAPDMALVDVMMPGMDGFDVAKTLKRLMPEIKIVMVTALNDDSTLFSSAKMHCDGFLEKPWKPSWLICQIESVLARRKHALS